MVVEADRVVVWASPVVALASSVVVEVERAVAAAGRVAAEVSRAVFRTPFFSSAPFEVSRLLSERLS